MSAWTIETLASEAAARAPENCAVIAADRTLGFGGLESLAGAMARALVERGVGRADRVGLVARNRADSIALLLACARVGAVLVPINDRLALDEVRWIVADAGCRLVFGEPRFASVCDGSLWVDVTGAPWWEASAMAPNPVEAASDDVVLQLYTSGTSGRPKGALLTHANWRSILDAWTDLMEIDAESRFMQVTPFFHVGGILMILSTLRNGATLVLLPAFDPALALDTLHAEAITHTLMVPSMVEWTLREPGVAARPFDHLRMLVYGAAPMRTETLRRAREVFTCDFLQGYGLTESAGVVLALLPEDHRDALAAGNDARLASAGRAIACCEVRVVDEAFGDALVGEIATRGGNLFAGYWRGAGGEAWTDGWFHTGDVGAIDAEGYITVVDRQKDMVLVGGENVYPREVERVLLEFTGVLDAAVVGAPHDVWGEVVVAFVVPKEAAAPPTERELIRQCRERLAHFKCPTRVLFEEALPRNAAGKLQKALLRERLAEDRGMR